MSREKPKRRIKTYHPEKESKKPNFKIITTGIILLSILILKFSPFKSKLGNVFETSTNYINMFSEIKSVIIKHTTGDGLFYPPCNFKITSPFGLREDPITKEEKEHTGIDYAAPFKSDIKATKDGEVTRVEENHIYGKFIMIKHDEHTESLYGHLEEQKVQIGDRVKSGEIIAKSGSSGNSTGPHLHFEIRVDKIPVNPEDYLK